MAWTKMHTQLVEILGELVPDKNSMIRYIRAAQLRPQDISLDGSAIDAWSNVVSEADKTNMLQVLIGSVLETYPNNPFLRSALSETEINYSLSPAIDDISQWHPVENDTLEVLTMDFSTLLPISFLALGVIRSKAVAKVEITTGLKQVNVGTGFLCQLEDADDLFFMTNYHVIHDRDRIDRTRIIFNYELDLHGNTLASKSFRIDKHGPWYTSPVDQYDVSIFKLDATIAELSEFQHIILKKVAVNKNDFVNIIQHPGGEMKQISIYHNIVTNVGDHRVQYLTDTLKGSSGSPVFNSNWDIVALHHSGGSQRPGEPPLPRGFRSRNEGIRINNIIDFLRLSHQGK